MATRRPTTRRPARSRRGVARRRRHGPCRRARTGHPGGAVELLALGEPGGHRRHQLRVEAHVATGRRGEVPGVDEVVGGQLVDVLGHLLVAIGQVHQASARQALGDAGHGRRGSSAGRDHRVGAEQVAVEAVTDVGDRRPLEQRRRPAVLTDDVVDERPYVPLGARRGAVPGIVGHGLDAGDELGNRPCVQRGQVHGTSLRGATLLPEALCQDLQEAAACRARRRSSPCPSRARRRPGSRPAGAPDRRRRRRCGSAGRGGCGPAARGGRRRGPAPAGRRRGVPGCRSPPSSPARRRPTASRRVDVPARLDPDVERLVAVQQDAAGPDDDRRPGDVDRVGVLVEGLLEALDLGAEPLDAAPFALVHRRPRRDVGQDLAQHVVLGHDRREYRSRPAGLSEDFVPLGGSEQRQKRQLPAGVGAIGCPVATMAIGLASCGRCDRSATRWAYRSRMARISSPTVCSSSTVR